MELNQITAVPIIMALTELFKNLGLPHRVLPLLNLVLGVVAGVILFPTDLVTAVVNGLVLGLTAAGLYRSAKVTLQGK